MIILILTLKYYTNIIQGTNTSDKEAEVGVLIDPALLTRGL
jgi:hypothetical protein